MSHVSGNSPVLLMVLELDVALKLKVFTVTDQEQSAVA
jgi:hypothetical protein